MNLETGGLGRRYDRQMELSDLVHGNTTSEASRRGQEGEMYIKEHIQLFLRSKTNKQKQQQLQKTGTVSILATFL